MAEQSEKQRIEALLRAGNHAAAIDACSGAISAEPDPADYYRLRGRAHLASGNRAAARSDFEAALITTPLDVRLLSNLGQLAFGDGNHTEAERRYREALVIDPQSGRAARGRASALAKLGRTVEAVELLTRSLEENAGELDTRLALAQVLMHEARAADAVSVLSAAPLESASDPRVLAMLGSALYDMGEWARACAVLSSAIRGGDESLNVLLRYALSCIEGYDLTGALATLDRAEALGFKGDAFARARAKVHFDAGEIADALKAAEGVEAREHALDDGSQALFFLSHHQDSSAALTQAHQRWARALTSDDKPRPSPRNNPSLRVGYLSPDLRNHVVMRFLAPVLEAHERFGLEPVLLSTVRHNDDTARALATTYESVDLSRLDDASAVSAIRSRELDVVIDLAGHSSDSRLALLAHRVAPLAASYLGYPSTTGLSTIDVRITDEVCDPLSSQADFTERLAHLGRCAWAYVPEVSLPAPTRVDGPPTFGCFNRVCKWSPVQLELFVKVLHAVPGANLLLKARGAKDARVRARVLGVFDSAGLGDRVEFQDWSPSYERALLEYRRVDVTLDTFPYGGTTTTCDSLLMGLPVVSLAGETPASRVGRSLLHAVGLDDYATDNKTAYVEIAARAMSGRAELAARRADLRQRLQGGELGDASGLTRALRGLIERELDRVR